MREFLLFCSLAILGNLAIAQTPSSRLLIIGIDGVRSDALTSAYTSNIDTLIAGGLYSPNALNDAITISGPGWSKILCEVRSDKHLVEGNDFSINNYDEYPSVFSYIENAFSDVNTISYSHTVDVNDWSLGVYFVVVENENGTQHTHKIAVR